MSGRIHVVEFRTDTTRPDQRESLVGPVPNSTTRTGPDKVRGPVGDPYRPNGLLTTPRSNEDCQRRV